MYATSPGLRPLVLPDLFTRWIVGLFIAFSLMMAGMAVHAAPTAGTVIKNAASASYSDAFGTGYTVISNEVTTTVQQVASLTLVANGAQFANPSSQVNYPHTLTNTGNGSDTFSLTTSNSGPGFTMASVQIFADDGTGTLVVNDATPAYTSFVAASCFTPPAGMTCAVTQKPAVGAQGGVQWTLTGPLTPGKVVQVTFRAKVDQ
jgi:hypothetical protein